MRKPISEETAWAIYQRDGGCCVLCTAECQARDEFNIDHEVPLSEGGTDAPDNLRTLCIPCHRAITKALQRRLKFSRRRVGKKPRPRGWREAQKRANEIARREEVFKRLGDAWCFECESACGCCDKCATDDPAEEQRRGMVLWHMAPPNYPGETDEQRDIRHEAWFRLRLGPPLDGLPPSPGVEDIMAKMKGTA